MTTYNTLVRDMLETMLDWYIGTYTDYSVSSGKLHKYLKRYLSSDFYEEYIKTYSDGNYEHLWNSIDISCELFRKTALLVAEHFNFKYPEEDELASKRYISGIKEKYIYKLKIPRLINRGIFITHNIPSYRQVLYRRVCGFLSLGGRIRSLFLLRLFRGKFSNGRSYPRPYT